MRSRAELRVSAGGRILRMVDAPPVAWRPTGDAVYLVGTAGGPAGDDNVIITVDVDADARLVIRSSAATVVYSGTGTSQHVEVTVGAGGTLEWAPEPIIVTARAKHAQSAHIRLDPTATLDWTELLVLGRHREHPGLADLRLDCVVGPAEQPLLRHQLTIGADGDAWEGPAVLGPNRAVGIRLIRAPLSPPPHVWRGEGWAWMALQEDGWLLSAVAPDLPTLRERMAAGAYAVNVARSEVGG